MISLLKKTMSNDIDEPKSNNTIYKEVLAQLSDTVTTNSTEAASESKPKPQAVATHAVAKHNVTKHNATKPAATELVHHTTEEKKSSHGHKHKKKHAHGHSLASHGHKKGHGHGHGHSHSSHKQHHKDHKHRKHSGHHKNSTKKHNNSKKAEKKVIKDVEIELVTKPKEEQKPKDQQKPVASPHADQGNIKKDNAAEAKSAAPNGMFNKEVAGLKANTKAHDAGKDIKMNKKALV